MSDRIIPITMPKWGLSMQEGKVNRWLISAGDPIETGTEVVEVESDKIAGVIEAAHSGLLRRQVAKEGDVLPVGALLAVVTESEIPESEIEAFVTDFQSRFVPGETEEDQAALAPEIVLVDGRRISYLRRGETGDPILLIHGFGGDKNNWLFNHEALASAHTVYALDLPGHGNSDKNIDDPTLSGFAKVLLGFADALKLKEFHLIGHSLGGAISLCAALESPDRIKSVTVISSVGLGKEIDAEYLRGFVAANSRKELKELIRRLFANEGLVTRQLVDDVLRFKRLDGVRSALEAILSSLLEGDYQRTILSQNIKNLSMPIRAIWGEKDRIIPASHAAAVGKDVHILPNAGHSVQMEAANEVNRLLRS
ncbi:MAG TPA: acetoin dehydrogenase dihydrolipoyllysine-residue acetyltransferase subunit [Chthoniobacterales bacterium]|nr:acetoin dehydrogenase dihydrolipoyllysine-residue acetyltransferase subunit [Chthoniobacterales bacterium]